MGASGSKQQSPCVKPAHELCIASIYLRSPQRCLLLPKIMSASSATIRGSSISGQTYAISNCCGRKRRRSAIESSDWTFVSRLPGLPDPTWTV
ncbi:hypothetical protein M404DRAFT_1001041 [Pisolithus tinctorius Marx 270]|uniref:Uncharacterized protein n=1 Tax=Pisolithus tinctorius Marx 270 TaxID=870435 RepID=A0A0C3K310_PISTI|nr:hypothetical protein M404DRAFT_1001041 [Pisolithus tinctorius Marx 270]